MKIVCIFLCTILLASASLPWMNVEATPKQRAQALLAEMTLQEKLSMVHGYGGPYVGNVNAIDRLKIPALHLEDGPQGVADGVRNTTCWPSALTVVATWNESAVYQYARAMGQEQRIKGTNIMLGPMVNIARVAYGGRNFESYGEDPHLAAHLVRHSVAGIQSNNIMACTKHFVDNNQETDRTTVSENVDERTQHEIYYPAFKAAAQAKSASFMCSYNLINNTYACENYQTLTVDLKGEMQYEGFVMSDWGATHSTVKSANNGLDMEMPGAQYFGQDLVNAVNNGQVSKTRVDDMVLRILQAMFQVGIFDNPQTGNLGDNSQSLAHQQLARELAAEATVLLKNEKNLLPLSVNTRRIAVIGDDGDRNPTVAGGGSGHVNAPYIITPLQGIRKRVPSASVTYATTTPLSTAQQVARAADVAVVFVSTESSEGSDRSTLGLGADQDALVRGVLAVQPNTIVVLHVPGATVMPWASQVPAILCAFFPGQEDGNAIADILFGDVNPSARLPLTFPVTEQQIPVNTPQQWPGINKQADYSEKLLVGYRWYDAKQIAPQFAFGHGLSYTTFQYSELKITGRTITFKVLNVGSRTGAEVAQVYIGFPNSAGEPPKNLKRFFKVNLTSGESTTITTTLNALDDLSIWDIASKSWKPVLGVFQVYIGASSRDIRLTGTLNQ